MVSPSRISLTSLTFPSFPVAKIIFCIEIPFRLLLEITLTKAAVSFHDGIVNPIGNFFLIFFPLQQNGFLLV